MLSTTDGECWPALWWGRAKNAEWTEISSFALPWHSRNAYFQRQEMGSFFYEKKMEAITQLQVQLEPSCTNVGNGEGWLTASLWDAATRPRSLRYVHNGTPTPFPPGQCHRHSQRCWGCSGGWFVAHSCLHLFAGLNSHSPPILVKTLKISRLPLSSFQRNLAEELSTASKQRRDLAARKLATKHPERPSQPGAAVYKIKSTLCMPGWSKGSCQHAGVCPLLMGIPAILPGGCTDLHGENQMLLVMSDTQNPVVD